MGKWYNGTGVSTGGGQDEFSTIYPIYNTGRVCFSSPWTIVISLIDIPHCDLYFISFYQRIEIKIMICARVLVFILGQILTNMIGLTTISWLINQIITLRSLYSGGYFSPEIRLKFGTIADTLTNALISGRANGLRLINQPSTWVS